MSSPSSVSHEIAAVLRSDILRGQYRVGERLPSERDLAAHFDVSRGAIREALSQLEQQGITETQPGGVRVKAIEQATLAILGPLLSIQETPDQELVDQFLEIFSMLTSLTVKGALKNADAQQMIQLSQMLVDMAKVAGKFESMQPKLEAMLDFMVSIDTNLVARLIGNDVKEQFVGRMLEFGLRPQLKRDAGLGLVKALELAFRNKDGAQAALAFEEYFDQLRVAVRVALKGIQADYQKQAI